MRETGRGGELGTGGRGSRFLRFSVCSRRGSTLPELRECIVSGEPGVLARLDGRDETVSQAQSPGKKVERVVAPAAKRQHRKARHVSAGKQKWNKVASRRDGIPVATRSRDARPSIEVLGWRILLRAQRKIHHAELHGQHDHRFLQDFRVGEYRAFHLILGRDIEGAG